MADQTKINSFLTEWPILAEIVNNITDDAIKISFIDLFNTKPLLSMVLEAYSTLGYNHRLNAQSSRPST